MTDLLGPAGVQTTIIAEIAANRAVIEQVKGILMMVYRIDADAAFDLLKLRSQEANIKCARLPNSSCPIFGHSTTMRPCRLAQCSTNYC